MSMLMMMMKENYVLSWDSHDKSVMPYLPQVLGIVDYFRPS